MSLRHIRRICGRGAMIDQRRPQGECSGRGRRKVGARKFGRQRRIDAINAVELATAPYIRAAFLAPMRRGIEESPAPPDRHWQASCDPGIVLPESEIYAMLFGNGDLAHRWASRGTRGFRPESATRGANSKVEANFIPIGCNPLKRLDSEK